MKNIMTNTIRLVGCCAMFYTLTAMGQSAEPTHQLGGELTVQSTSRVT
jgi:hypothetical protein